MTTMMTMMMTMMVTMMMTMIMTMVMTKTTTKGRSPRFLKQADILRNNRLSRKKVNFEPKPCAADIAAQFSAGKTIIVTVRKAREEAAKVKASKDEAKLAAAIATLEAGIEPLARWPKEIQPDVASAKETIETARAGLVAMEQKRRQGIWQDFRSLLQDASGFRAHLSKQDFLAASASLTSFATRAEANAASARAKGLAQCAEHASEFATALSQSIDKGDLRLTIDKTEHKVNKWDREAQRMTVRASRRKEQALDCREMSIDQWISLANQVEGASQLNRNCFLSMVTIDTHCRAAKAYLGQLNRASDDTGTGQQAYPYAAVTFERLLNKLPRTEDAWSTVLGDELQAGKRLASGLRALSEKRNTAAAAHIEKRRAMHIQSEAMHLRSAVRRLRTCLVRLEGSRATTSQGQPGAKHLTLLHTRANPARTPRRAERRRVRSTGELAIEFHRGTAESIVDHAVGAY